MARSYSLPTMKALFGEATHCAYPDCPESLVFEDVTRGVRTIAVQIAHIRSEKPDGPRFDAAYDPALINTGENLLLLCGKHHGAVDQNESIFTTEELVEWKVAQRAQAGGTVVTDLDLSNMMQTLESSLSALHDLLRVAVELEVVASWRVGGSGPVAPLANALRMTFPGGESARLAIGVQVVNKSASGIDVSAGFELDFGVDAPGVWWLEGPMCPPDSPHRVDGRSTEHWLVDINDLGATIQELGRKYRRLPTRFRPFADLGDGSRERGDWHDVTDLPVWKPGMTSRNIDELNSKGRVSDPGSP